MPKKISRILAAIVFLVSGFIPVIADTEIRTPNSGELGIFDPSVAIDPETGRVWMSHSIVDLAPGLKGRGNRATSIGLSFRDAGSTKWQSVQGKIAKSIKVAAKGKSSRWMAEVSSLFRDPGAPESERWKVVYHRYLHSSKRRFEHGWISMKVAATPQGLVTANEIKLFTALGYKSVNDNNSGWTRSPVAGAAKIAVHEVFDEMSRCVALTEPGTFADKSTVFLSLICPEIGLFKSIKQKTVILRCAQPCNFTDAKSWQFVGVPLTDKDARSMGSSTGFSGSELYSTRAGPGLFVTPTNNQPFKNAYNGCFGFDLNTRQYGLISRRDNLPLPSMRLNVGDSFFHGACDFLDDAGGGTIYYARLYPKQKIMFRIFSTPLRKPRTNRVRLD